MLFFGHGEKAKDVQTSTTLERDATAATQTAPIDETLKSKFLDKIEQSRKSLVSNWYLSEVRAGIRDAETIVERVICRIQQRLRRVYNPEQCERDTAVLVTIEQNLMDAIGYARYALQWESLTPAQKSAIQSERSQMYVAAAMSQQEPTSAQIRYLHTLGYDGEPPANKADAADLISHYVARKQGGNLHA